MNNMTVRTLRTDTQTQNPQQLVQNANIYLEEKEQQNTENIKYSMLAHTAYRVMPTHTFQVSAQGVTFLVDSGAAESVVKASDLIPTSKMSSRTLRTIGETGNSIKERYMVPEFMMK